MTRRSMKVIWMLAGSGCATTRIVDPDVIGASGEHLVKLQCEERDQCLVLARHTCGDFEVVSSDVTWGPSSRAPPGSEVTVLVHCKAPPGNPDTGRLP